MKEYYIILTSDFLQRTDIDPTMKLILGYIATRLNIPEVEWTISKTDLAKQLGLYKQVITSRVNVLIEKNILTLKKVIPVPGINPLELYEVNRQKFEEYVNPPGCMNIIQTPGCMNIIHKSTLNKEVQASTKNSTKNSTTDLDVFAMIDGIQTDEQKRLGEQMDYRNAQSGRFKDKKSVLDEWYNMIEPKKPL